MNDVLDMFVRLLKLVAIGTITFLLAVLVVKLLVVAEVCPVCGQPSERTFTRLEQVANPETRRDRSRSSRSSRRGPTPHTTTMRTTTMLWAERSAEEGKRRCDCDRLR